MQIDDNKGKKISFVFSTSTSDFGPEWSNIRMFVRLCSLHFLHQRGFNCHVGALPDNIHFRRLYMRPRPVKIKSSYFYFWEKYAYYNCKS